MLLNVRSGQEALKHRSFSEMYGFSEDLVDDFPDDCEERRVCESVMLAFWIWSVIK